MELLLLVTLALLVLPVASLIVSAIRLRRLSDRMDRIERRMEILSERPPLAPPPAVPGEAPAPPRTVPSPVEPAPTVPPLSEERLPSVPPARPERKASPPEALFQSLPSSSAARTTAQDRDSLEQRIGTRWVVWVGALVLVLALAYFIKYAIESAWLGPTGRVTLGILAGGAMLAVGEAARRRAYPYLGQGLTGGGIAMLYLALFAASSFYELIPRPAAFLLMLGVTAGGVAIAVLQDAIAIAILSTLGGFLTPILLSTGQDQAEVLFVYLFALGLGVLGAAFYRRWRALDLIAYIGTMILYGGWHGAHYHPERMPVALSGLWVFWFLFLVIPVIPVLRRRVRTAPEAVILPALAGLATLFFTYRILYDEYRTALASLVLIMAAAHMLLARWIKSRIPSDHRLISGHLVLAVAFLTLAIPIRLGLHAVTLAWAAEGPVLIFLGFRYRERLVRLGGVAALALATLRLFTHHWPLHESLFRPLVNRPLGTVLLVVLAFAVAAWVWRRNRDGSGSFNPVSALVVIGGVLLVTFLSAEIHLYGKLAGQALQQPTLYRITSVAFLKVVWGISGFVFVGFALRYRDRLGLGVGTGWLGLAALDVLGEALDFGGTHLSLLVEKGGTLILNRSFLASLFVVSCLVAAVRRIRVTESIEPKWVDGLLPKLRKLFLSVALCLLWLASSREVYSFFASMGIPTGEPRRPAWIAHMALTVTWTLFAFLLLGGGFILQRRAFRYAALALFGLTLFKAVFVDLAEVRQLYRVLSLLALGLALVSVSYLYSRAMRRAKNKGKELEP